MIYVAAFILGAAFVCRREIRRRWMTALAVLIALYLP